MFRYRQTFYPASQETEVYFNGFKIVRQWGVIGNDTDLTHIRRRRDIVLASHKALVWRGSRCRRRRGLRKFPNAWRWPKRNL